MDIISRAGKISNRRIGKRSPVRRDPGSTPEYPDLLVEEAHCLRPDSPRYRGGDPNLCTRAVTGRYRFHTCRRSCEPHLKRDGRSPGIPGVQARARHMRSAFHECNGPAQDAGAALPGPDVYVRGGRRDVGAGDPAAEAALFGGFVLGGGIFSFSILPGVEYVLWRLLC